MVNPTRKNAQQFHLPIKLYFLLRIKIKIMIKMKSTFKLYLVAILLSGIITIQGCIKEEQDLNKITVSEWNPSLAIPLVNSSLGLSELLIQANSSLIKTNSDGLLLLTYKPEPFSTPGNDLIQLPDQIFNKVLANGVSIGNPLKDTTIKTIFDDVLSYNTFKGARIDSIEIKSGYLSFFIKSSFKHDITVKINLPSFKKNGVPITMEVPVIYAENSPLVLVNKRIDLSDYTASLANNKIPVSYSTEIKVSGSRPISSTDKIEITQTLGDFKFKALYGYFGQFVQSMPLNTIALGLFDKSTPGMGKFSLANPTIRVNIENTLGIPIKGEIKTLETTSGEGNAVTSLLPFTGKDFSNPFIIPSPLSPTSDPGKLSLIINNENAPNLTKLLSSSPKNFSYAAEITLNPDVNANNFITEKSKITISPELELPLEGTAYGFSISDTFNFPEIPDTIIESLLLRANITNMFPLNVRLQVTFLDAGYQKLDSLFTPIIPGDKNYNALILSGEINSDGKVISATNKITDITYSKSRAANLRKAKYMAIRGELETSKVADEYKVVKFFDSYKLDIKLGAQIQGKIKL